MEVGKYGFPSEKHTHPLLEALLPPLESFPFAEERRLFYVALTRAKHRAYLVVDMAAASRFVIELLNDQYPIELNEFGVSLMQRILEKIRCQRCYTGVMQPRSGPSGHFFGCSHFPRCKHTEKGCTECGMPMHKVGHYYICVDPDCGNWRPACTKCCAIMNKRHGRYGEFWACSNYHGQQEHSCDQTSRIDAGTEALQLECPP
jgi:DNA helicase-4